MERMTVKELIEKLKEFDDNLEVYVDIGKECRRNGCEEGMLIDDKRIEEVELGRKVYFNKEDEICVILR